MSAANFTGRRFGMLVVSHESSRDRKGRIRWACRCDCGATVVTASSNLTRTRTPTTSCGCVARNRRSNLIHGMSGTPQYLVWRNMRARCENPNHPQFHHYGARGIKVCAKWETFCSFWDDMGATYSPGAYLDRADVDGDYLPENCRWVTPTVSSENRRNAILVHYNGKRMNLSEASRLSGVQYTTLFLRVKRGCPEELLFVKPVQR